MGMDLGLRHASFIRLAIGHRPADPTHRLTIFVPDTGAGNALCADDGVTARASWRNLVAQLRITQFDNLTRRGRRASHMRRAIVAVLNLLMS